jgi:HEAT repeat protein
MRRLVLLILLMPAFGCGKAPKKEYTVPTLIETLKDPSPDMRYWAARELGKLSGQDAKAVVPALTEALGDPDEMVRMGAAYALGSLGRLAAPALPALQKAAKDRSQEVRAAANYAVKQIRGKR